eukprot:1000752-Prymnesium_polylepis.1
MVATITRSLMVATRSGRREAATPVVRRSRSPRRTPPASRPLARRNQSREIMDSMEAGHPPRGRSPVPPHAGQHTVLKAWTNKIFGLSGALLDDHNAGVREDIRVCHECGRANALLIALLPRARVTASSLPRRTPLLPQDRPRQGLLAE